MLNNRNLTPNQISELTAKLNYELENIALKHFKRYTYYYRTLNTYYAKRVLTQTDLGCRIEHFDLVLNRTSEVANYLVKSNKPTSGILGVGLISTVGLTTARDFAYHSPFISPYDVNYLQTKPSSINTYRFIGIMARKGNPLD